MLRMFRSLSWIYIIHYPLYRWFIKRLRMEVWLWVCWWSLPCSQPHGSAISRIFTEGSGYCNDMSFARHPSFYSQLVGWSHQLSCRPSCKQAMESSSVSMIITSSLFKNSGSAYSDMLNVSTFSTQDVFN